MMASDGQDTDHTALVEIYNEMNEPMRSVDTSTERFLHSPPSYEDATDSGECVPKELYCDASGENSNDEETEVLLDINEKQRMAILEAIESLKKEQEAIKQMQEQHGWHIKELLDREPCVKRQFQSFRKQLPPADKSVDTDRAVTPVFPRRMMKTGDAGNRCSTDHVYLQLEQLYANLKVFHFPMKTLQTVLDASQGKSGQDSGVFSEMNMLKEENSKLKLSVHSLEERLKAQEQQMSCSSPPLPEYPPTACPPLPCKRNDKDSPYKEMTFIAGRPTVPQAMPTLLPDIKVIEMTFTWTISDYRAKLREERISGRKEFSSPFYLSHCGYKAQMECYLNGNGTATNRCMSVFLRVIKGDYDRHLKWPVNLHLVVILVNQAGNNYKSLKAGGNQFQFARPCSSGEEEGDCWGLVEFVSHEMIQQRNYIKDDKIILKCRVTTL
ncbi:uncharacterized protein LOC131935212 [Physella acuta]|uniref:uncharacterized protein LOC131935212 n=1 Tax=Physella acuta TaxID=109671 RepID=UPI0027DBF961|nr:uncharacterized protein LOC131935212 [Physella acuta]